MHHITSLQKPFVAVFSLQIYMLPYVTPGLKSEKEHWYANLRLMAPKYTSIWDICLKSNVDAPREMGHSLPITMVYNPETIANYQNFIFLHYITWLKLEMIHGRWQICASKNAMDIVTKSSMRCPNALSFNKTPQI